ncbi:hypothetical protein HNV12_29790 [Methanococcoides sp. SA1]|nr:hypothetical protein [Methanococcoides sp. SA1]
MQRRNLMGSAKLRNLDTGTHKFALTVQNSTINSTISGQAFTEYTCRFCGESDLWVNTAVLKLCIECSIKMVIKITHNLF